MKSIIIFLIMFLIPTFSSASNFKIIINSIPTNATISTSGYSTLNEEIDIRLTKDMAIRLPSNTIINTIRMSYGQNPIKNINIIQDKLGYLISLSSDIQHDSRKLQLSYSITGIEWTPNITVNYLSQDEVEISLNARIKNQTLSLENTTISLVATPQQSIENYELDPFKKKSYASSTDVVYEIGQVTIPKHENSIILSKISIAKSKISNTENIWNTNEQVVRKYIYSNNPFKFPICDSSISVIKNNVVISETNANSPWTEPNSPFLINRETNNDISCSSAVEVVEDLLKRKRWENSTQKRISNPTNSLLNPPNTLDMLPDPADSLYYKHSYEFSCSNKLDKPAEVNVLFEKKYGNKVKNIYNFETPPTESPGKWHIWSMRLQGNQSQKIKFNIDSDTKTYKEYKKYRKAMEGC